ncbi:MAG: DUF2779 domain-containing protein [Bacteroidota bacterium]|nr:DUF2779 domain-containing protein [Bacteroidota bacterium]
MVKEKEYFINKWFKYWDKLVFFLKLKEIKMSKRYLTKSRFKIGSECTTKLFYTKKDDYPDAKTDDPFLAALAQGGYQVGELAKQYYPNGHDIKTLDYEKSLAETAKLLEQDEVVIYEGAICFENLFIRADIIVKKGNRIKLIEVKAKSINPDDTGFMNVKGDKVSSDWKAYLEDVAFQKFVISKAYPKFNISSYLMLADKSAKCATNGLNQKFQIVKNRENRTGVEVSSELTKEDIENPVLAEIKVSGIIDDIISLQFIDRINILSAAYANDKKISEPISAKCAKCEYRTDTEISGFKECWKSALNWKDADFSEPSIFDIWNFRGKDALILEHKFKMEDLCEEDFNIKCGGDGLSQSERQWLQVEKEQNNDKTSFVDKAGLKSEMSKWKFPLHFIDFETSAVAIPFNKGMRPYEQIAFQFSHHTVYEDGRVEHSGEYLNNVPGKFPNFEFLQKLKEELENDEGTIFKFAAHENTILNAIYRQLKEYENVPNNADELCEFIKTISHTGGQTTDIWKGERDMVDLCEVVKKYYYNPHTKGSNSIKAVLPAILDESNYLQEKYSKSIYGLESGIKSLNFKDKIWLKIDNGGKVINPYKQLEKPFDNLSSAETATLLSKDDAINNGGAALTTYGVMQFAKMTTAERNALSNALLKYCELDTLAMVMIYEGWRDMVK